VDKRQAINSALGLSHRSPGSTETVLRRPRGSARLQSACAIAIIHSRCSFWAVLMTCRPQSVLGS
jgi:hypothetical protein